MDPHHLCAIVVAGGSFIRETLVALLAMLPGGRMPDRELVVAEVISRKPG